MTAALFADDPGFGARSSGGRSSGDRSSGVHSSDRDKAIPAAPAPAVLPLGFEADARLAEVYEHADDPDDPMELRDLYVGRVEGALGAAARRPDLAERWASSRRRRTVAARDLLTHPATVSLVKELFNFYFRDDLYGELRQPGHIILSSGAVDEEEWGLPTTVKRCIAYALERDWYGYSDSRGRVPAREAIARYEEARLPGAGYDAANVALTMGGTFAVNSVADFLLTGGRATAPALCAIPNYPPLVASIGRRATVQLVPTPSCGGTTAIRPVIEALRPDTPLVLLQTAANPTGAVVVERDLEELIHRARPSTTIVLDECHEWLGPPQHWSKARAEPNVVRVSSLSKNWSAPGLKIGWILASREFVSGFYEYASSAFGGPPSFLYTAVEVIARMERWRTEGRDKVGRAELSEFEPSYGLVRPALAAAYESYVQERIDREHDLIESRDLVIARLRSAGIDAGAARYSINLALRFDGYDDSYLAFRTVLMQHGISLFPGILTFCLSGGIVRITTARPRRELDIALERLCELGTVVPAGVSTETER